MGKKRTEKIVFENVEVLDAGAKGVSVAKAPDGKVIFLPNVVPGDVVDIQTLKKRKAYYEGKATKIHTYSKHRTEPVCEHFGVCGGCKWQNMKYEQELFYRNKMEFGFSNARWMTEEEIKSDKEFDNKNALGFHIPRMWDKILDIEKCHLQQDPSNAIRNEVRTFANANNLTFFNPREHSGFLRTLMIRTASTGEIMVLIQFI